MKVILISKVPNYGNIGDVVEVKSGYAKNFLIPNKRAIHYSTKNFQVFEQEKGQIEAKNNELLQKASQIKASIDSKDIVIIENASDDGRLYGAVTSSIIAKEVAKLVSGIEISRLNISLEKPIKETGVYDLIVNLYSDVSAKLRLIVSRNESEIESVIESSKSNKKGSKKSNSKNSESEQQDDQQLEVAQA